MISICIPVHNTEALLERCLDSIYEQDFNQIELVIVNDNSSGKNQKGWKCKKIIRKFQKKAKIPVTYIEHFSYVPLLETRRELVEKSAGDYILMIDSDDFLAPDAIKNLVAGAEKSQAEIVCGQDQIYKIESDKVTFLDKKKAVHVAGPVTNHDIFYRWLVKKEISGFLWAKIIKRDLYLKAFDEIPYMDCSITVDLAIFFYISYFAKSYYGIEDVVYYYYDNFGITGDRNITSLKDWERYCTASSNYSLLFGWSEKMTEEELETLRKLARETLRNCILKMNYSVLPELRPQAREMLCEYWGEGFVKKIEELMKAK